MKSRYWLPLAVIVLSLTACSSAPKKRIVQTPTPESETREEVVDSSPLAFIDRAQQAYSSTGDIQLRNQWLLRASEAFEAQQRCDDARKILRLLRPELVDNAQLTQANLLEAECQLASQPDLASLRQLRENMAGQLGFDARIATLDAYIAEQEKRWLEAADATLRSTLDEQEKPQRIWFYLQQMTQSELQQARLRPTNLLPEIQLALIVHQHGWSAEGLQQQVEAWQRRYVSHPMASALPQDVQLALQSTSATLEHIAVMLPMSGRLASQGNAIKQGLLAAYYQQVQNNTADNQVTLQFFDSNRLNQIDLSEALLSVDAVIGPLLRENIEQVLAAMPAQMPMLALNRVGFNAAEAQAPRAFFALAPEDEARQLASRVVQNGAQNPIILAHEGSVTRRMAEAFIAYWTAKNPGQMVPAFATFNDNKSMRDSVTTLLDVKQSKARVKQIETLLGRELHAVARNRRDIDAIIVFANPEQTELLNPIIESSLSPFNDANVPVFASSRSYSQLRNKNSLRDLRNLTFTDMPWMLPSHRWQALAKQSEALWPQRNHTLQRLFALGYDSFTLLPNLTMMQSLPQLRMQGMTGQLQLDSQGRVTRELPMGRIDNEQVSLVAVD